jgi:hypothetical protein
VGAEAARGAAAAADPAALTAAPLEAALDAAGSAVAGLAPAAVAVPAHAVAATVPVAAPPAVATVAFVRDGVVVGPALPVLRGPGGGDTSADAGAAEAAGEPPLRGVGAWRAAAGLNQGPRAPTDERAGTLAKVKQAGAAGAVR